MSLVLLISLLKKIIKNNLFRKNSPWKIIICGSCYLFKWITQLHVEFLESIHAVEGKIHLFRVYFTSIDLDIWRWKEYTLQSCTLTEFIENLIKLLCLSNHRKRMNSKLKHFFHFPYTFEYVLHWLKWYVMLFQLNL